MKRFQRRSEDQKRQIPVEVSAPQNDYYESISYRFGLAQVFLYLFLLAYVAVSLLMNTELITYHNLYYFVKDLNAATENVDVLHSDAVSYPTDAEQSFTLYRQGLAVAGNSSVTVFTSTGRQTISKSVQYQNPVAVGTGKYLLVYEQDGTRYSLYNSYTQIHSGKTASPIRCATMSDCGMYAIVTEEDQYPSVVELYSSDFELLNRYRYQTYVTDVAVDARGNHFAVLTNAAENGSFTSYLKIYEPKKDILFSECKLSAGLGIQCGFTDSGNVSILCGNGVYYTSVDGKLITEVPFEGQTLTAFDMTKDGCVAVLKPDGMTSENQVAVYDEDGERLYGGAVEPSVRSVALCGKNVYFVCSNGVTKLDCGSGEEEFLTCETEGRVLLAMEDGRILLCSPKKAMYYKFES